MTNKKSNPPKVKWHFITKRRYTNPDSTHFWYKSACNLISSGSPSKESEVKEVNCKRCLKAMEAR